MGRMHAELGANEAIEAAEQVVNIESVIEAANVAHFFAGVFCIRYTFGILGENRKINPVFHHETVGIHLKFSFV